MKTIAALSFALFGLAPIAASAADDVMIVYDGSNSMWGQIEGVSKIEIARDVMAGLVETWPQSTNLGLLAYGHRREGDCTDIELMVKPGPVEKGAFLQTVNSITPRGRTPLTAAVEQAAEFLSYRDNPATVVLVSDGVETCQADPCALAAQLERQGVAFTAHVIGFDLSREEHEQLACIAENTGGIFVPAENADELRAAMTQVQATIESEPVVEQVPEPEPVVEPETPPQTVSAPATVTFGTDFTVTWGETVHSRDWVVIVPAGADEGTSRGYRRVESHDSIALRAPAEPGLYEVRYVLDEGNTTLASTPVEVVAAEQTVSAPATVTFGTEFTVSWGETINPRDWVVIVPSGADEGTSQGYRRVESHDSIALRAPAEPGLYEVRYVLDEGNRTLASTPVEVVAAEQTVSAPATVTFGTEFIVSWGETINPRDWVVIVPSGADEGTSRGYRRVESHDSIALRAPAEPGLYEVRYVLDEGNRTLASTPVEVVAAEQTVSAPATVTFGTEFTVSWGETINPRDWVVIVPAGADEGTSQGYRRVENHDVISLRAPSVPGLYEVRYVLDEGNRTLASTPVEIVEAQQSVSGPEIVRAESEVTVTWGETVHPRDWVVIVAVGADEGTSQGYRRVENHDDITLTAPAETGLYEIRYVLDEGSKTLASSPLEVVAADAPLDDGAGLNAPASATPSETVTVSWTISPDDADRRVALAKADAPDFTWISAHRVGGEQETEITLPDTPGQYEVRFLDISSQSVLGRAIIAVGE
ncbi:VWA domain-containing protein [Pelagibacterium lacus]|nr:VWA domain-containing protein [Pelagibacterium lacus]